MHTGDLQAGVGSSHGLFHWAADANAALTSSCRLQRHATCGCSRLLGLRTAGPARALANEGPALAIRPSSFPFPSSWVVLLAACVVLSIRHFSVSCAYPHQVHALIDVREGQVADVAVAREPVLNVGAGAGAGGDEVAVREDDTCGCGTLGGAVGSGTCKSVRKM